MSKVGYIISGTCFGDEGKGTFTDYLSSEYNIEGNVRYNGGSQAAHTVILDDGKTHTFSQLGSHQLSDNRKTYLSDNTIVNLFNIYEEIKVLNKKKKSLNILNRIYIDKNSPIVTPYHKLINQLKAIKKDEVKRGTTGTGVSEVNNLKDIGLLLQAKDFNDKNYKYKLKELYEYSKKFYIDNKNKFDSIKNIDLELLDLIKDNNKEYIINCYENLISNVPFNITNSIFDFSNNEDLIFEGSQGLLIDKDYGIKPNTTLLDTTNKYGVTLCNNLNLKPKKIGIISALYSRHGIGIFPTYSKMLSELIIDKNQVNTFFQGKPVNGWFDCVLTRYSHNINNNEEYYMSKLDLLSNINPIKICDSYTYKGNIDETFYDTFEYFIKDNNVIIKNIKENNIKLKGYLENCFPNYIEMEGFNNVIENGNINKQALNYIKKIEDLTNINVSLISIGPTRKDKKLLIKK